MPRRAANFIPPQRRPEDSPAVTLFVEPEDPIRIMGEMIRDADLIHEKLRGLAFADDHYRADLRVIRGVAVRTADRCAKLLDEVDPKPQAAAEPEDLAGRSPSWPPSAAAVEASNIIDAPEDQPAKRPARRTTGPTRPARERNLGSPAAVPVPGGVKAAILKQLERGPLTTGDLIEKIVGPTKTIYQTLSILRGELLIVMLEDQADGQRKNYLRNQAEAMATG